MYFLTRMGRKKRMAEKKVKDTFQKDRNRGSKTIILIQICRLRHDYIDTQKLKIAVVLNSNLQLQYKLLEVSYIATSIGVTLTVLRHKIKILNISSTANTTTIQDYINTHLNLFLGQPNYHLIISTIIFKQGEQEICYVTNVVSNLNIYSLFDTIKQVSFLLPNMSEDVVIILCIYASPYPLVILISKFM